MNGIIEITIQGKKERLKFNNYATTELESYLIPKDKIALGEDELSLVIAEKWEANKMLLMKNLVYSGLVGQYYLFQDTCPYTKEEVAEYVGNAPYDELMPIFQAFFKANSDPNPEEEVKKKKKPKKKVAKKKGTKS